MKTHVSFSALALGAVLLGGRAHAQDAIVPDDFPTISNALTAAADNDGDGTLEIFVRAGTYAENVRITRSDVLLEGETPSRPTIQGTGGIDVLNVEAFSGNLSNVTVRNFLVTGGLAFDGVEYRRVVGGAVTNVEAFGNSDGIRMNGVTNVTVSGCLARNNAHSGFQLTGFSGSTLAGNEARDNGHDGIDLGGVVNAVIETNDSHHNGDRGVRARRTFDTAIRNNQLHDNFDDGARFEAVTRVSFTGNVCNANRENGLRTRRTLDCLVSQNQFTNNDNFGVRIRDDINLDFSAAPGIQGPLGDNTFAGNDDGPVRSD
jgi:parallel beta-helix repeat protein